MLKQFAKDWFPPILLHKFRILRQQPEQRYFGLNELDRRLEPYLNYNDGYYVELGANDGVAQSNTLHFERFKNWCGVLVEPVPHNYLKCRTNRSRRNSVYCAACVRFGYDQEFVKIAYSNLMSTAIGVESEISDPFAHASEGGRFLGNDENIFMFGAKARTLTDILQEAGAPHRIDLLSLDVEGVELEVLKGVDHLQYRFNYLVVENRAFDELEEYLKVQHYEFIAKLSHHDYLFRDTSKPS